MDLRQMITDAIVICGGLNELAKRLEIHPTTVTNAKHGRRGLPDDACGRLAQILNVDPWLVICARNLVTEKNEEKRSFFSSFLDKVVPDFALHGLAILCMFLSMTFGQDASANVKNFLSAYGEKPVFTELAKVENQGIYIMRNC